MTTDYVFYIYFYPIWLLPITPTFRQLPRAFTGGSRKDLAIQRNTRLLQAVSILLSAVIPGARGAKNAAI